MPQRTWKKRVLVILAGGVLLQAGGCVAIFAPSLASVLESILLTFFLGTAP